MRTVTVHYVRHGETASNARKIMQGHIDTPLNDRGRAQAAAARDALKDTAIDICYTSDLSRASQTAEIIMEAHPAKPMIPDTRLKEEFLGELQGKVYNPPFPAEWLATVEPREDLIARLTDFHDDLFPSSASTKSSLLPEGRENLTIVIVTHSGPIATFFQDVWNDRQVEWTSGLQEVCRTKNYRVENCSISTVVMQETATSSFIDKTDWKGQVISFCETGHLDSPAAVPQVSTHADVAVNEMLKTISKRSSGIRSELG